MKIRPEDLANLTAAIDGVKAKIVDFPAYELAYKKAGLRHMRFRWDMLYASRLKIGSAGAPGDINLYDYMNDEHIDTALRFILGSDYPV